jgi:hypothetical protein
VSINNAIDRYGNAAQAGLFIEVVPDEVGCMCLRLIATPAALEFLGHLVSGLLEEDDCHFSLEPFGAGNGYFQRARYSNPGIYLHRQPCHSAIKLFPEGRGIGWVCFVGHFDDMPLEERDYDPAFVAIEGDTNALLWLKETFLRVASEGHYVMIGADELHASFGPVAYGLEIILTPAE